jgi:hypothetical protein
MLPISAFNKNKIYRNSATGDFNLIGKIKVRVLVVLSVVIFALIFAQLVFANNLATEGQKLAQVYTEIRELEAENTLLKVEIAKKSSLASLSKEAQSQGFRKPEKVITF